MDTAVSGLVNPGDRVDIFGYFKEGRGIPKTGTREILKNVRVFAVNDQTAQETDPEGRTIIAKTVSVLVKQDQVAKLMLATELGTLRLALRRPNEETQDNPGENASIETLFGTHSESADDGSKAAPGSQLASAAGGFVSFLNNLKSQSQNNAAAQVPLPVADVQLPRGPAWQMTVLTPDGGTQFTWNDEHGLPATGESPTPSPPALQTSTPVMPSLAPPPVSVPQPVGNENAAQAGSASTETETEPD
jgi:pilus assembly protein CpaB